MWSDKNGTVGRELDVETKSLLNFRLGSGERVVENLTTFAEKLYQSAGAGYRDPGTLVAPLSEILSGKRRCPEKFRQPILLLIEDRMRQLSPKDSEDVCRLFRERLEAEPRKREPFFACERPDVMALRRSVLTASHILAVLPRSVFEDQPGRALLKIALERAGTIPSTGGYSKPALITLWFRGRIEAMRWWLDLFSFIRELQPTWTATEVECYVVESCERGLFQVYAVPPMACAAKVIIAEPESTSKAAGFTFYTNRQTGLASLSLLPPEGTKEWLEDAYRPLTAPSCREVERVFASTVFTRHSFQDSESRDRSLFED
jgi:hypothetical protein